jgi:hypothetical protein
VLLEFVFLFGFLSVIRAIASMRADSIVRSADMPKIGIAVVLFGVLSVVCSCFFPSLSVVMLVFYVLATFNIPRWIRWRRLVEFERDRVHFLSHLLLKMKAGESLRSSLSAVIAHSNQTDSTMAFLYQQIQKTLYLGEVPKSLCKLRAVDELAHSLLRAEKSSHHCVQRLQNLRDLYQKHSDFRRRSGQVTTQIRAQSVVLALLYFALFVGMMCEYGTEKYVELRLLSLLLFVLGIIMVFYLGGRMRWKI